MRRIALLLLISLCVGGASASETQTVQRDKIKTAFKKCLAENDIESPGQQHNIAAVSLCVSESTDCATCRLGRVCQPWARFDSTFKDGPVYYVDLKAGELVGFCSGWCRDGSCEACPPKTWKCAN